MLLRASLGMAIVISLMGCVTSVYQLVALRLLQGIFSGYISNATAFVATGPPKEKSGQVLGTLATGSVTGTLLGPLLGGISASAFGYRPTFFITGIILFFVFLLSLFFVHEKFVHSPIAAWTWECYVDQRNHRFDTWDCHFDSRSKIWSLR